MKTLIIDNYDSFTYNIYQLVAQISDKTIVVTNNQLSWSEIQQGNFDNIIISPGPGHPEHKHDFGVCAEVLLQSTIPVLGICLGHQGLGYYYGCKVVSAPEPFHGRVSSIYHQGDPLFASIPSPFQVVRYHSLILEPSLSEEIQAIATTENKNLIMGIKHKSKPFWGVQFHPESIASQFGKQLLLNFNRLSQQYLRSHFKPISFASTKKLPDYLKSSPKFTNPNITKKKLKIYSKKLNFFRDSAQVFHAIYRQSNHSFWLDSSMVAKGLSRFSYMGACEGENSFLITYKVDRQEIILTQNNQQQSHPGDIFNFLQQHLDQYVYETDNLPFDFNGGFVGYWGYELKSLCGSSNQHNSPMPDAQFIFVEKMLVFDHQEENIYLVYIGAINQENTFINWSQQIEAELKNITIPRQKQFSQVHNQPKKYSLSRNKKEYLDNINTCLQKIKEGESYEICLTNNLYLDKISNPLNFYLTLRKNNPAPYSAFFKLAEMTIACSSPERFLYLDKNGYIESKPIKGTVKRGKNLEEDKQLKNKLKCSKKEQAENLMIVDLLRNDLGRVCEIASVNVPKLMAIESYSTVHQMVSTIRGKVKKGIKPVDCIKACFPGGSMTGTPKKRTMEIIDQLETEARGIYSGCIGFLALNGTLDLNIVIRTAVITPEKTTIGIGGAITTLSYPDNEFAETILKAKALLDVAKIT
jgi:para-aminobenzoate synthetase